MVGAGAVGLYYGGRLAAAGEEVRFLLRSDYEGICAQGLTVESIAGDFRLDRPLVYRDSAAIGPVDLVIVSWKATANACLQEVIAPLLHEDTCLLTLQNGLGNTELLAELFGAERVLGGLCFVCINRIEPGLIRHTGGGLVTLGDFSGSQEARLNESVEMFARAGITVKKVEDLGYAQWVKLVWNVPFNGLCISEGGIGTGELLARPDGEGRVRELMGEVLTGARALGYNLPDQLVDDQVAVTYPMGAYRPSSMIDYLAGREVELDAIWEEPLRRATEAGAQLPVWRTLVAAIRQRLTERPN